jgi:T-complex protein 1 subunit gamma
MSLKPHISVSAIIFSAGEMMSVAEQFLEDQMHPTVVIGAYRQALEDMLKIMKEEIRCFVFSWLTNTIQMRY